MSVSIPVIETPSFSDVEPEDIFDSLPPSRAAHHTRAPMPSTDRIPRVSEKDEKDVEELTHQFASYKDRLLRQCQARFIRYRKPAPERIRQLVKELVPELKDLTSRAGFNLYETAKKAFENMRDDLIRETKKIAVAVHSQITRYVLCPSLVSRMAASAESSFSS